MKKCDEASLSIISAGRALLVKMLIILEPLCAFGSNFESIMYFNTVQYWYANSDEASSSIILAD